MKQTTLYLLLCAAMLCYTGVTYAEASVQTVSKIDATTGKILSTPEFQTAIILDCYGLPELIIQGDMYYSETIAYCDFVEECIEDVYLEPDSPVPLIASHNNSSLKTCWREC